MDITRFEPAPLLSLAVTHGESVHLSGIVCKDILKEIDRLLAQCGSSKSRILTAMIWVSDIRNRAAMNEVWTAWIDPQNIPARACVEARLADPRTLVEIMVVAAK